MKAQKLGLFLGMNMAAACMMMQGCASRDVYPDGYKPINRTTHVVPQPSQKQQTPAATSAPIEVTVVPEAAKPEVEVVPAAPVVEPQPTQVAQVKPVSAQPQKPVAPVAAKPVPVVSATPAPATTTHVVARGDSLSGISKRYNVKMASIVAANPGLKPDRIRIGQKIAIPSVAPAAPAVAAAAPEKDAAVMPAAAKVEPVAANTAAPVKTKSAFKAYEGPTKEYVVKSGDSLGKIAYENGISIRALKALNGLQKDNVRVGQKLQVPAEKAAAAKPEAKAAAPAPAAAKPAAPAPAAKPEAAAEPAKVAAPVAAPAPEKAEPAPAVSAAPAAPAPEKVEEKKPEAPAAEPAAPAPAAGPTYKVKEGDDVVSVAISWGISPSQLMDLNDLKAGDPITPGQVLKLPATAKQQ